MEVTYCPGGLGYNPQDFVQNYTYLQSVKKINSRYELTICKVM